MSVYLGIDVGTGSARAGLFNSDGEYLGSSSIPLETRRPDFTYVEQSSRQIWSACCAAVRSVLQLAGIKPEMIAGIGFDATCSLVAVRGDGSPITVSVTGNDDWNVILWMDHRASDIASGINAMDEAILERTGGKISPEMSIPKLVWLKEHMPQVWRDAGAFYELPDWLVHQATASTARSFCSAVCKWTYLGERGDRGEGWDNSFLNNIGLGDLVDEEFCRVGTSFRRPGERAGGLTRDAARELGLIEGTPVAMGAIDAYAGAIGTLGVGLAAHEAFTGRLALVGGTSTCHLTLSQGPVFVDGVWGPYFEALLPGLWANEGGQSVSGALIERILKGDAAWPELEQLAVTKNCTPYEILNERLECLSAAQPANARLCAHLHVLPDFHGNRSPLGDPERRGAVIGLSMETGLDALALLYLSTMQALAYGTRHIQDGFRSKGVRHDLIVMSGGLARNPLYRQQHADATGCKVLTTTHGEAVLLGGAIMGALASGNVNSFAVAMKNMGGKAVVVEPDDSTREFHNRKYRVFRKMQEDFGVYRELMNQCEA